MGCSLPPREPESWAFPQGSSGLEEKCRVEGSVEPTARVKQPDGTTSRTTLLKCEAARVARARNSPAVPGLEAQCAAEAPTDASDVASAEEAVAAIHDENTIIVRVRYRRELGYKVSAGPFGNFGRTSCGAFTVSAAPMRGRRRGSDARLWTHKNLDAERFPAACQTQLRDGLRSAKRALKKRGYGSHSGKRVRRGGDRSTDHDIISAGKSGAVRSNDS